MRDVWDRAVASDVAHPALPDPPPRIAGAVVAPDPDAAPRNLAPRHLAGPAARPAALTLAAAGAADPDAVRTAALDDPFAPAAVGPAADSDAGNPAEPGAAATFADADVVATVNGEPVLAGDVLTFALDPRVRQLAHIAETAPSAFDDPARGLTPGQRDRLRREIDAQRTQTLARALPAKIEETLLAQRMRRSMEPEQLEGLNAMVGSVFRQTELPGMLERVNETAAANGAPPVRTEAELDRVMTEQGTSLKAYIDAWKPQQMAMAYVEQNAPVGSIRVSRGEVAEYYEAHLADFTPPKSARWSQIEVPYGGPAEKVAAVDVLEAAAADLARGEGFADVAARYSRGPHAEDGGAWDWAAPGSLADDAADAALWNQTVGEIGPAVDCPRPHAGAGAGVLKLIRVEERRGDAAPPLSELKGKIEDVLKSEKRHRAVTALLAEERARAQIEVFVPGAAWPPEG